MQYIKNDDQNTQLEDSVFEQHVHQFIDAALKEDTGYQPGLESFELYANRKRHELKRTLYQFRAAFRAGVAIIREELEAKGQPFPTVTEETLTIFDNKDALIDALNQGKAIYQLLGFSSEIMCQMYDIAVRLAGENKDERARDVFYFLVTIAPDIASYWLGLGMCYAKLKDTAASEDAFLQYGKKSHE